MARVQTITCHVAIIWNCSIIILSALLTLFLSNLTHKWRFAALSITNVILCTSVHVSWNTQDIWKSFNWNRIEKQLSKSNIKLREHHWDVKYIKNRDRSYQQEITCFMIQRYFPHFRETKELNSMRKYKF